MVNSELIYQLRFTKKKGYDEKKVFILELSVLFVWTNAPAASAEII